MAFSNETLTSITGYTGQMGQGRHKQHVEALAEKVKQGDQDAFNRLNKMNQYFDQQGMGGYKFNIPSLPQPKPQPQPQPQPQQTFDKARLAQISGYDQTPMFRGFGGTVDTAMGKGRHGNYVFDLLAASRGGDSSAREKLEAMNRYFDSIPGYSGAKIDIDGASFSDKPVNRELRQVTGYTGLFGPDAKAAGQENFGKYVEGLRDSGKFEELAKVNEVLEKYGYESFEVAPTEELTEGAQDAGYMGDPDDVDAIGRFLSAVGSKVSYVDQYGQLTPTGKLLLQADAPTLAEGAKLALQRYEASPDEFLQSQEYLSDPNKFQTDITQASAQAAAQQSKTVAGTVNPVEAATTIAAAQMQGAQQQGLSDLVTAQTATVDAEATVQGQLNNLMSQFEGGQVPAFASGAIRLAEQRLAARGMGASSMAGAAIMQAAMEAATPIAAADAQTYARMAELNLNNRQQAEVLNSQMTLQLDLQNLSNRQQAEVINTQNRTQSIFNDQAAVNSARQFNAQSAQQNDQFFANMFNQTSQFNTSQQNAIAQYNAGQANALNKFNSELASQREQFETKNKIVIDQANATYRRTINTANTALDNAASEFNVRNLFNISQTAQANLLQQHRDELNFARVNSLNRDEYNANLALAAVAYDRSLKSSTYSGLGSLFSTVAGGLIGSIFR